MLHTLASIEEMFLKSGTVRMSDYFDDEIFENNISAHDIFWDKDDLYYTLDMQQSGEFVIVNYSYDLGGTFAPLVMLSTNLLKEELEQKIAEMVQGWTPEEEMILGKYIDLYAKEPLSYEMKKMIFHKNEENKLQPIFVIESKEKNKIFYEPKENSYLENLYLQYKELLYCAEYEKALELFMAIFNKTCEVYGETHSNVIALLYDIVLDLSCFFETEELLSICLKIYMYNKEKYGNFGLQTLVIVSYIAKYLGDIGEKDEAVLLAQYVNKGFIKRYGEKDEHTIISYSSLASHYYGVGLCGKALSCIEHCLANCDKDNIYELIYYNQFIALIYREMRQWETSLEYEKRVYDLVADKKEYISKKYSTMDTIARLYLSMDETKKAVEIQSNLVRQATKTYGIDNYETLKYWINLSIALGEDNRYEEAHEIETKIYDVAQKLLGTFDEFTMDIKNNMVISLVTLGKREEAKQMAQTEHLLRKENLGEGHEYTMYSLRQYLDLRDNLW